ncbi:hypothetical protein [uncultured Microbulbifer sp.]|uniref:hypothetical protein n=1 Tax=uncultured Microbulbifer sp. TaxID=348147 RepID=UPI0025D1E9EF|nr:hypothetical protein [uncultured Microbulbifer sp.]
MRIFSLNGMNQFSHVWPLFIYGSVFLIIPLVFDARFGAESLRFAMSAATVAFLVVFIPHMAIHARYLVLSRGVSIGFYSGQVKIEHGGITDLYSKNDISKVEIAISKARDSGLIQWFPWDGYSYAVITLKTGYKILITSLVVPHLEMELNFLKPEKHILTICWPPKLV